MLVKIFKILGMTALIAGLVMFNVGVGQAAEEPGAGFSPETAIAPTVGWTTIEPGAAHWYTFNYDYVHENESTNNASEQIIARLEMANPGSVEFVVQTMDRLGPWLDDDDDPGVVGRGSPRYLGRDDDNDSLFSAHELAWAGSARTSGDFLIIVEGDGGYQLTVEGETVNFTPDSLAGAVAFAGAGPSNMAAQSGEALAMGPEAGIEAGEIQSETFALSIDSGETMVPTTAGSGPGTAMAPTVGWTTIEPGAAHWYTFNYDYVHENESTNNASEQIIALLEMANPGSVEFAVQTMDRLGPWLDEDDDPGVVGRGSPLYLGRDDDNDNVYSAHELAWAGSARTSGDFLIIVEGDGGYQLTVEGETVNFTPDSLAGAVAFVGAGPSNMAAQSGEALAMGPEAGMNETEPMLEEFALNIVQAPAPAIAAGYSPETALAPTVGWTTVQSGESHWYAFNYDYANNDDNDPKQAIATLEMATPGSVGFVVQTLDRLGPWTDSDDDPGVLGASSPLYLGIDDDNESVYSVHEVAWAGSSKASGTYYIIVEGNGDYRLTVDGETVYFPEATLVAVPTFAMTSK